jgi:hypothetical protein
MENAAPARWRACRSWRAGEPRPALENDLAVLAGIAGLLDGDLYGRELGRVISEMPSLLFGRD